MAFVCSRIRLLILLVLPLAIPGCSFTQKEKEDRKAPNLVSIAIYQDGRRLTARNDEVLLAREEFQIVFRFRRSLQLLVNVHGGPATYALVDSTSDYRELPGFRQTGMAEGLRNADREIFLNITAPHFWFFENQERNRFDELSRDGDIIRAVRTVKHINRSFGERDPVESAPLNALYLVFVESWFDKANLETVELGRSKLKLSFHPPRQFEKPPQGELPGIGGLPLKCSPDREWRKYQVKRGDSPGKIATRELGKLNRWREIMRWNRDLLPEGPYSLRPGMYLRLQCPR